MITVLAEIIARIKVDAQFLAKEKERLHQEQLEDHQFCTIVLEEQQGIMLVTTVWCTTNAAIAINCIVTPHHATIAPV